MGEIAQGAKSNGSCSFGFARTALGERSARTAARFLEQDVLPVYRELGIPVRQVTVDGGGEFKGAFTRVCKRHLLQRHQLPPRSPDLNAFVERFQGTCLHLLYRIAFRYRFYTDVDAIDADLQAWLRFYNFERPHRGHRTAGRIPAAILYRDRPDLLTQKGWNLNEITA